MNDEKPKSRPQQDNPEVLGVVPLPTAEERRCRKVMLARVMLVAIDLSFSGESLRLETARRSELGVSACLPRYRVYQTL